MKNCRFCFHPVPDDCFALIKGRRSGKEFKMGDEVEFVCQECVERMDEDPVTELHVGDVVLVMGDS